MALEPGTRLGPYEIVELRGKGGMGEVYRARDSRLGREVAVKVLPSELSADASFRRRFDREAKTISQLQHPNVCTLHDVGSADGLDYLVMEFLEGETLEDRLAGGALPRDEVRRIGIEIAEAIEAAHRHGLVHRDLKPGNVMLTATGTKVLDFGLARDAAPLTAGVDTEAATQAVMITEEGQIVGTVPYMAPEQLHGSPVDSRADIWALGCILHEMTSGDPPFDGRSRADLIASILTAGPAAFREQHAAALTRLDRIVKRCLEKDPERRWQSARDVAIELEEALVEPDELTATDARTPRASAGDRAIPWLVASLLGIVLLVVSWNLWDLSRSPSTTVRRFPITLPSAQVLSFGLTNPGMAISPKGTGLVYAAAGSESQQLYLRDFDQLDAVPVPRTEGGSGPFFSPDGQWVGFGARGELRKVSLRTGEVFTLCDAARLFGASWGPDNEIVFVPGSAMGIWRVSADGGERRLVAAPDFESGERSYRFPEFLPGGKEVIFAAISSRGESTDNPRIEILSLETGERQTVLRGGTYPKVTPTGHLLYSRGGRVLAVPFDLARREPTGDSVTVLDGVLGGRSTGFAHFSVSSDGSLVYPRGAPEAEQEVLVWIDRKGVTQEVDAPPGLYGEPSLSAAGRLLARRMWDGNSDLWSFGLPPEPPVRLTFDAALDGYPTWTPDRKMAVFGSNRAGTFDLYRTTLDGSSSLELVHRNPHPEVPVSWSPDATALALTVLHPTTLDDVWILTFEGDPQKLSPFAATQYRERQPMFSPDGDWIAYTTDETGEPQVWVQPYPGPGQKLRISTDGGEDPVWNPGGDELFYRRGNRLMLAKVTTKPSFSVSATEELFETDFPWKREPWTHSYAVSADGERILTVKPRAESELPTEIIVVLNWFEELERLVPTG